MVIVVAVVVMKDGIECVEGEGIIIMMVAWWWWWWWRRRMYVRGRAADVYWHFDGCPSHLRKKKEIVYEGLTRMRRATPRGRWE
jgi:hypothetical protein